MTCGDIVDIDRITQDTYILLQNAKFHKVARSGASKLNSCKVSGVSLYEQKQTANPVG
jgi:hypothetical protein